jgi:subtilisin family serine protease
MRLVTTCFFLIFSSIILTAQNVQYDLWQKAKKNPSEFYPVYIVLNDFPDLEALGNHVRSKRMTYASRHAYVLEALRSTAESAQPAFLEKLASYSSGVKLAEARQLWICNAIFLPVRGDLLSVLASLPEVEGIYPEITGEIDAKAELLPMNFAPNGTEPGLRAIGARELWKMGYTGYGRRAMIFDSGGDWNHPALRENFHGLYVPVNNAWSAPNTNPFDVDGHGTHVAGTVLGIDRLRNDTIGVAFNATWLAAPVQFGNAKPQPAPTLDFLSNMQFAVDPNGDGTELPDVVNNSWSGGSHTDCAGSSAFSRTVRSAEIAGVALVWSAGNSGPDASTVRGYQNANFALVAGFSVGATSAFSPYTIADFSSRGPSLCGGSGPLAIKPEVSAPGVSTRSAYVNGTYAALSGTSMASPHVSGAVLLLKEAFPYLAGEDILMALYMSAIDLGEPGEDNVYGRGIINLPAAFDYLVDQGYVPEPPLVPHTDVLVAGLQQNLERNCNSSIGLDMVVENSGLVSVENMLLQVKIMRGTEECLVDIPWSGALQPGERVSIPLNVAECAQFFNQEYVKVGRYEIFTSVLEVNGSQDDRPFNNKSRLEIRISGDRPLTVTTEGLDQAAACANTSIILEAKYDGPGVVEWYNTPNYVNPLHIGKRFETPVLGKPVRYFPRPVISGIGMVSHEEGEFSSTSPETGSTMFFDVHDYLRFESVTVFSSRQGVFVFQICDPQGNCNQISRVIRAGENVIPVNQNLTPGQNWSIVKVSPLTPFYTTTNTRFPYHYPDLITIIRSDHPDSAYLYFYNWRLTFTNSCPLDPVDVEMIPVLNTLVLGIQAPDTITLTQDMVFSPVINTGISDQWALDFGDGSVALNESFPVHQYSKAGDYMLSLSGRNSDGCMHKVSRPLTVIMNDQPLNTKEIVSKLLISLFPNPTDAILNIQMDKPASETLLLQARIVNSLGQTMRSFPVDAASSSSISISVDDMPAGIYFLEISESKGAVKSFKWVKK